MKTATPLSFLQGCRVGCAAGKNVGGSESTWEVKSTRKKKKLIKGLSPADLAREQELPAGRRGNKPC